MDSQLPGARGSGLHLLWAVGVAALCVHAPQWLDGRVLSSLGLLWRSSVNVGIHVFVRRPVFSSLCSRRCRLLSPARRLPGTPWLGGSGIRGPPARSRDGWDSSPPWGFGWAPVPSVGSQLVRRLPLPVTLEIQPLLLWTLEQTPLPFLEPGKTHAEHGAHMGSTYFPSQSWPTYLATGSPLTSPALAPLAP